MFSSDVYTIGGALIISTIGANHAPRGGRTDAEQRQAIYAPA